MNRKTLLALSIFATLSAIPVFGQTVVNEVRLHVRFQFRAGQEVLPAGSYQITYDPGFPDSVKVRKVGDNTAKVVGIIARLARDNSSNDRPRLVFDTQNDQQILSEIWAPWSRRVPSVCDGEGAQA